MPKELSLEERVELSGNINENFIKGIIAKLEELRYLFKGKQSEEWGVAKGPVKVIYLFDLMRTPEQEIGFAAAQTTYAVTQKTKVPFMDKYWKAVDKVVKEKFGDKADNDGENLFVDCSKNKVFPAHSFTVPAGTYVLSSILIGYKHCEGVARIRIKENKLELAKENPAAVNVFFKQEAAKIGIVRYEVSADITSTVSPILRKGRL